MQKNFYSSIIHNNSNLETMEISNSEMGEEGKWDVVPVME